LAPRLIVNEPAIGQRSVRTASVIGFWLNYSGSVALLAWDA
jgi:hypothetical protein